MEKKEHLSIHDLLKTLLKELKPIINIIGNSTIFILLAIAIVSMCTNLIGCIAGLLITVSVIFEVINFFRDNKKAVK